MSLSFIGGLNSLIAQLLKNPAAIQETPVRSWVGKIAGEGKGYPLQYSGLEKFHGLDTTEQLALSFSTGEGLSGALRKLLQRVGKKPVYIYKFGLGNI